MFYLPIRLDFFLFSSLYPICYFQIVPNSVIVLLPRQLHSGFVSIAVVEICQQFHKTYHETQNTCEYTSCRKNSSVHWLLHPTSRTSYTVTVSVKFTEFVAKKENMQALSTRLVETRRTRSLLKGALSREFCCILVKAAQIFGKEPFFNCS